MCETIVVSKGNCSTACTTQAELADALGAACVVYPDCQAKPAACLCDVDVDATAANGGYEPRREFNRHGTDVVYRRKVVSKAA